MSADEAKDFGLIDEVVCAAAPGGRPESGDERQPAAPDERAD